MRSVVYLSVAVFAGGLIVGCAEALDPKLPLGDETFRTPATPSDSDAYRPITGRDDASLGDSGSPSEMDSCSPGSRLGVCEFCGPDGAPVAPESDAQCPPIQCPERAVKYERRQEDDVIFCDRIEYAQAPGIACTGIGVCATTEEVCDTPTREVVGQVNLSGCREMTGCQGTIEPELAPANAGDNCDLTVTTPARYIRIRAREGRHPPVWSEIEVLGGPFGAAPVNLAIEPTVEVQVTSGVGDALNDGDLSSSWTSDNDRGSVILDLGQPRRIETVRVHVATQADDRAAYEISYGIDLDDYRLVHVFRGPFNANTWVEFSESGICGASGQCEGLPHCEDYRYQDRGRVCDVGYQNHNRVCEFFVAEDEGDRDRRKTCRSVCEASGLTCVSAGSDIDDTCRVKDSEGCNESMKDFICRCLVP